MKYQNKSIPPKNKKTPVPSGNLLIIFTRNPVLGKCKTRLAKTVGDETALGIYKFLLHHTVSITKDCPFDMEVHYSEEILRNDIWDENIYNKKQQVEGDLGTKMEHAFLSGFKNGYRNILLIGSDMYDLQPKDLKKAFKALKKFEYVLGPSEDGGYYLIGMNFFKPELFQNKAWGTDTVLRDTLIDLKNEHLQLLDERNDIDTYEDIKDIEIFKPYITLNS